MSGLRAATQTAPRPLRQWLRRAATGLVPRRYLLAEGPEHSNTLWLTFDDGPHPIATPAILDLLAAANVKATFFVIGQRAADQPALIQRMQAEGHCIGHHSWSHGRPEQTSASTLAEEAARCRRWLREMTGVDSPWFRPPHGKLSVAKLARLWLGGARVVLWNLDPGDVAAADSASIEHWLAAHPPQSGDIILLHDTHSKALGLLPRLIADAKQRGLRFATVAEFVTGTGFSA